MADDSNHSNSTYSTPLGSNENSNDTNSLLLVDDDESNEATTKQLRNLAFVNPGKFMDNFDPERSSREMRKVNRRIYRETVRKNQVYDEHGRLLDDISRDLCDCLEKSCPGCHFPCSKCQSQKCGADCRCNRRWHYSELEVEGGSIKLSQDLPCVP